MLLNKRIRKFNPWPLAVLTILLLILLSGSAAASGFILPRHEDHQAPAARYRPLAIISQQVRVDINNQAARTTIRQVFSNHTGRVLEGTYIFPVPENASVSDFAMWMNGRKIEAELLEAGQARRIYNDIVRRMQDPGLLEYAGRDMFRARVFPIPAHGDVKIEIKYDQVLEYDAGLVAYRYPLSTERFCRQPVEDVSVAVNIKSNTPIKTVYSPSHDLDVDYTGSAVRCGFEQHRIRLDRDFILYYAVSDEELGLNLISHRLRGEDGYFMLLLSPGQLVDQDRILNKDVVFVIDKSGSMRGEKIEQAKDALEYCVHQLRPGDRFNIIAFSTTIETLADRPVPVDRKILRQADQFIRRIRARGGTNINQALQEAMRMRASRRPQMVVFLTDGLPTVGETGPDRILRNVARLNRRGARVFSFGVGYDVNTFLLDKLTEDNRGTVTYIKPAEDIEEKVASFFDKVSRPVLSNIDLDIRGVRVTDMYPKQLPDLFSGSQLVLFGRYDGGGRARIRLSGDVGNRREQFEFKVDFRKRARGNGFIPRLWASRKIAYLLSEINLHGYDPELKEEVIFLAKEHGIVTPYTSYLVVEDAEELAFDQPSGRFNQVQRLKSNVKRPREGRKEAVDMGGIPVTGSTARPMPQVQSGREATDFSRTMAEEKERQVMADTDSDRVAHVGGKTFYFDGRQWLDREISKKKKMVRKLKIVKIKYLSEEYFKLMDSDPEIGKILALGKLVTFEFEGKAYQIVE